MRVARWLALSVLSAATLLPQEGWAIAASQAEMNYLTYCTQCHGTRGNGKGINARDMAVQPRDHTDAKHMSAHTDAEIFRAIKEGGEAVQKSVLMPPWGAILTDEEIHGLAQHLRTLCRCEYQGAR